MGLVNGKESIGNNLSGCGLVCVLGTLSFTLETLEESGVFHMR